MAEELSLLIELCSAYDNMGKALKIRLEQVVEGDRLDNHPDTALREIGDWLTLVIPFISNPENVIDLVDDIEMYLFGTYLEDDAYG